MYNVLKHMHNEEIQMVGCDNHLKAIRAENKIQQSIIGCLVTTGQASLLGYCYNFIQEVNFTTVLITIRKFQNFLFKLIRNVKLFIYNFLFKIIQRLLYNTSYTHNVCFIHIHGTFTAVYYSKFNVIIQIPCSGPFNSFQNVTNRIVSL